MSTLRETAEALRMNPQEHRDCIARFFPGLASEIAAIPPETYRQHQHCAAVRYWAYILAKHKGNVSAAAREAGVNRTHAHRLIRAHSIDPGLFRSEERAS